MKRIIILLAIILVLLAGIVFTYNQNISQNNTDAGSTQAVREVIANSSDDPGSVEVIRNVGNPNGEKIAYVVGVHPLEHETHETLVKLLPQQNNLNYCYDIYIINVTEDVGYYGDGSSDNSQGRQNGQNLAYKYV